MSKNSCTSIRNEEVKQLDLFNGVPISSGNTFRDLPILDRLPENWVVVNATTLPDDYVMVSNNKSRFSGKRKLAVIKVNSN